MRKLLCLLVMSVLAAPLARADGSIAINGRVGVAKPWGDFRQSRPMSDVIDWEFPLQADLQFRFTKSLQVGGYVRYAPTTLATRTSNDCSAVNASCSANDLAFGGVVEYRFSERLEGGGWVGASFGYEMLKFERGSSAAGAKLTSTATGLEGGVQAGVDFELGGLTIGPFLQVGAGQFTKVKVEGGGQSSTDSIPGSDKKLHGYAGLGLRFTILL